MNTETTADIRERVTRAIQAVEFGYYENHNATTPKELITFEKLCNLAGKPSSLAKDCASVIAPHAAPAKTKNAVIEHDAMVLLWADIDDGDLSKEQVVDKVGALNCASLIYSTASSCRFKKGVLQGRRWRVVLPLKDSISLARYLELQSAIVDYFDGDTTATNKQQIMYGPTNPPTTSPEETRHYEYAVIDDELFDADNAPIEIKGILARLVVVEAAEAVAKDKLAHESIKAHREHIGGSNGRIINLVNANHDLLQCFMRHGYRRIGKKFLSPNSSSESPGVLILGDDRQRWFSFHDSDKGVGLTVDGGQCGDAFDIICRYEYGGDISRAVRDLANKLDPEGQKQRQQEYNKSKAKSESGGQSNDQQDAEDKNMAPPRGTDAMLYGLAGEVGRAAAKNTEANPYAACMGFLVSLSAAVGRDIFYQLGDDVHHPRIFTLHVGRSGRGRKGSSTGLTGKIRAKVDSLHRKSFTGNMVDLVDHPHIMGQQHTGGLSSREGLAFLIHDGYSTGKTEVPAIIDKRLMIIESEFVNVLHQGKRDGNTLSAALRDIWDGKTIKPATKTATMGATDPHIAMLGNITPSELVSSIDSRELTNGFANRFLIFWAEKMKNVPRPKPTDESLVMNLAIKTLDIVRWAKGNYPDDQNTREMTLSDDAGTLYDNVYPSLCRPIDGGLLDGILERRAAYAIRLSMLFAITDKSLVIEVRHLEAALAWVNHSVESVRYIFSSADKERQQQEVEACAKTILEYLQQKPDGVTKSQINRELFKGKIPDNADDALNLLLTDAPPKVEMTVVPRKDGKHGRHAKFYRALRH